MPTILTQSAGSARGYGFTGNPTYRIQKLLQNTTWVAPPGVTSILTLTGKGQDGTPDIWSSIGNLLNPPGYINGDLLSDVLDSGNTSSSVVESFAQSQYDLFPSSWTAGSSVVSWECRRWSSDVSWTSSSYTATVRVITGFNKSKGGNGWGTSYPPDIGRPLYYVNAIQYLTPATNGANTTGFGYTFAGGVAAPATPVTYNNVPVTPGTTYTVNSTGDGYITILYLYQGG